MVSSCTEVTLGLGFGVARVRANPPIEAPKSHLCFPLAIEEV